jgi:hypothetical protein
LLEGCRISNPKSQELLYRQFYGYAMSVCLRYTCTHDEAGEIVNDGFIKIFNNVDKIDLKQFSKHLYFQVEPYLKTPLSGIGRGGLNLYSSGLLFSTKYEF